MRGLAFMGLGLLVALASGCVSQYGPPTPDQPHALVKLRRSYQSTAGVYLRERMSLDEHPAYSALENRTAALAPRTDVVLVHPVPVAVRVRAGFSHVETRLVNETYSVQVPYSTSESYSCGSGTQYRTCSRSVTRYRSETRTRTVLRQVEVSDGSCAESLWMAPKVGGEYVVNFDYAQNAACHLACFEQVRSGPPGTFENRPCPEPTPAEIQKLLEDR